MIFFDGLSLVARPNGCVKMSVRGKTRARAVGSTYAEKKKRNKRAVGGAATSSRNDLYSSCSSTMTIAVILHQSVGRTRTQCGGGGSAAFG